MSDTKGHTIQVVNGPAGPSLYLDDYRIAGPKPWGGGTVLHEFAFKDKDLIAAGVTLAATPAPLEAGIGGVVEESHMEGDVRVIDKVRLMEVSVVADPPHRDWAATPAPLDVALPPGDPTLMSGYKPAKRTAATSVTPAPNGHQTPGEYHDYRVACAKCGEPGFLHVSWRPETWTDPGSLTAALNEEARK